VIFIRVFHIIKVSLLILCLSSFAYLAKADQKLDIHYSSSSDPLKRLDVYLPENNVMNAPVLIHFHGGGWIMGDKSRSKKHGDFYAARGIIFIAVNYRLSPDIQQPAHTEDCAEAVSWVFDNLSDLGGDSGRVFVSGHSAGAHLSALLATDSNYLQRHGFHPKDFAGIFIVNTASFDLLSGNNERPVRRFIKTAFGSNQKALRNDSTIHHITERNEYPAFLIFASGNRTSAITKSKYFSNLLNRVGGDSRVEVIEGHNHRQMNLGMHESNDPIAREILAFILGDTTTSSQKNSTKNRELGAEPDRYSAALYRVGRALSS